MNKSRIHELDLLRGVAILAVIASHSTSVMLQSAGGVGLSTSMTTVVTHQFLNQLARFSTPLFVFLSGLVLTLSQIAKPLQYKHFLKKRLARVAIPYIAWTAFLVFIYNWQISPAGVKVFLSNLLTGNADYQLYYVVLTIQLYMFFPFLYYFFDKLSIRKRLAIGSTIFLLQAAIFLGYDWYRFSGQGSHNDLLLRLFFFWIFYFVYGMLVGFSFQQVDNWLRKVPLWVAFTILITGGLYLTIESFFLLHFPYYDVLNFFRPSTLVYALLGIGAIYRLIFVFPTYKSRVGFTITRVLSLLGKHSFGMFLVHTLVLEAIRQGYAITHRGILDGLIVFGATVIISLAIVWASAVVWKERPRLIRGGRS